MALLHVPRRIHVRRRFSSGAQTPPARLDASAKASLICADSGTGLVQLPLRRSTSPTIARLKLPQYQAGDVIVRAGQSYKGVHRRHETLQYFAGAFSGPSKYLQHARLAVFLFLIVLGFHQSVRED
jgi:hypothetical protein